MDGMMEEILLKNTKKKLVLHKSIERAREEETKPFFK
jgi:hypothetical protein